MYKYGSAFQYPLLVKPIFSSVFSFREQGEKWVFRPYVNQVIIRESEQQMYW